MTNQRVIKVKYIYCQLVKVDYISFFTFYLLLKCFIIKFLSRFNSKYYYYISKYNYISNFFEFNIFLIFEIISSSYKFLFRNLFFDKCSN